MKKIEIFSFFVIFLIMTVVASYAAGPSDERIRGAYRMILAETDTNKDGKLSLSECKSVYKDPATGEKNCNFWDSNKDGIVTEEEYIKQARSLGKK